MEKLEMTVDGIEKTFAVNYLGHYVLTQLLMEPVLHKNGPSRIINVASIAHSWMDNYYTGLKSNQCRVNWKEVSKGTYNGNPWDPFGADGHSKAAMILHAKFLNADIIENNWNVTINSCHPGCIFDTNLHANVQLQKTIFYRIFRLLTPLLFKKVGQGASTQVMLACHPQLNGVTGKYFQDCGQTIPSPLATSSVIAQELKQFSQQFIQES
ncbi:hypothetical protein RFI_14906 [Reticulomyxa filosa]|uniref:Uncharacterized protein n=1 Tax=Reticulomyxa filosa TaxID=46433 RepID=X6N8R4_RETFI|nr:hypothetical protein RFI_14906 [Reticulomyxa filosa]|eukprot:ETO22293.1 hypothetical protein RFI_14906 [Reticulomyxa filosa]